MKTQKNLSTMSTEELISLVEDLQKLVLEQQEKIKLLEADLARAKKSRPSRT